MNPAAEAPLPGPEAAREPAPGLRRHALPLAAIALLGLAAYANALGGPFLFDDIRILRDDPALRDLGRVLGPEGLRLYPQRWFAFLTFSLNYRLLGPSPTGFHAVNVLVHLGSAALVYALVLLAFRTPRLSGSSLAPRARAVAFVAAALFVAHPLQTQAVTYIVQRMTSLATLLYVAAVVAWLRWRIARAEGRPGGAGGYVAALVLALLAMKTKEIAFTLPFAIVLAELAFFETTRADLVRLLPVLATAAVVPVTWLLAGRPSAGVIVRADAVAQVQTALPPLHYLATQLAVIVTYLFLLLAPIGQNLDHDYPVHRSFLEPEVLSGGAVLLALAALGAWLWARTRPRAPRPLEPAARLAAFGIAWWFLAHAVESSVIPIADVINEHRVYLPSVGLFAAIAVGIAALAGRGAEPRRAALRTVAAGAALALALAAASFARNRVWASDLALWTDAVEKSPGKSRPWLNLGTALRAAGRPQAALAALRRGLAIEPGSLYGRQQLAGLMLDEAQRTPDRAAAWFDLGSALRDADDPKPALAALRRGLALEPTSVHGRSQLAAVLLSLGRGEEAEPELRRVLAAAPDDPEALFNLATRLWQTGRRDEARPLFARFAATAPDSYAQLRPLAERRAAAPPAGDASPAPR